MAHWLYDEPEYWHSSDADVDQKLKMMIDILSFMGPTQRTFKCALVGAHCQNIRIVDVPLRCGVNSGIRPMDLDVMLWIPPCKRKGPYFFDFNQNQYVVDQFPFNGENILDGVYTFYYQPQKAARARWDCGNVLAATITTDKAATWYGDILVIKTKTEGAYPRIMNIVDGDIPILNDILRCALIEGPRVITSIMLKETMNLVIPKLPLSPLVTPHEISSISHAAKSIDRTRSSIEDTNIIHGSEVYRIPELIVHIIRLCDWPSLVQISNCDIRLRLLCQYVMRNRIRIFLKDYIPEEYLPRLFEILSETSSFVTGALLHGILCASDEFFVNYRPTQLDIVVSNQGGNSIAKWDRFLRGIGWKNQYEGECNSIYQELANRSIVMKHDVDNNTIYLLESKTDETLPLVLSAPYTSMMDILSPTRIYCFYPELLLNGENMSASKSIMHGRQFDGLRPCNFGLRTYKSTDIWSETNRICNESCPAIIREVKGLLGICVMKWGGIQGSFDTSPSSVSASDGFEDKDYGWKLGGACGNTSCPFYGRGIPLDSYDPDFFNFSL